MADFSFHVLVFGLPMPEYQRGRRVMIESNLFTPVSYKVRKRQIVNGELREHEFPVTPYQVRVDVNPTVPMSLFRLYVDGVLVNWNIFGGGKSFIFKGVCGSSGTRELLFAPSQSISVEDKVQPEAEEVQCTAGISKVGIIEVVQYEASYRGSEYKHWKGVSLRHYNKKEIRNVAYTNYYPSAISTEGKLVEGITPSGYFNVWDVGREVGRQCVEYHMAQTLRDMGICLAEVDWGKAPTTASTVKNW